MAATPRQHGDRQRDDGQHRRRDRGGRTDDVEANEQTAQAGIRHWIAGDPCDVVEPAANPEDVGVPGEDEEADEDRGGERQRCHHRSAPPADEDEIQDEQGGRELDACDDPDADAGPPPRVRPEHVGDHDGEDDEVDLAQLQGEPHRVQPTDEADQHRAQGPPLRRGGDPETDECPSHDVRDQNEVPDESRHLGHRGGDEGQRQEAQRGERRVVEQQRVWVAGEAQRVEILALEHPGGAEPVDLKVDLSCESRPAQVDRDVRDRCEDQNRDSMAPHPRARLHRHHSEGRHAPWAVAETGPTAGGRTPTGRMFP
ncbi:hypothetical protein TUM20985_25540 [Mycobacterium antarcticum]|nr:hypothetical protein TUM20985_25540 [Mycolicibacterium sp. TUM20985]GLP75311.1 hypothetical protein TUM20983_24210 [Mycolicibacterium sp. TUM20983]GLP84425.1 hypothetical protein TUM20984_58450 [Mycolicibacterium sp. TUM20984]